jgi:hypothetical protein
MCVCECMYVCGLGVINGIVGEIECVLYMCVYECMYVCGLGLIQRIVGDCTARRRLKDGFSIDRMCSL